jgi:hypothetical protein
MMVNWGSHSFERFEVALAAEKKALAISKIVVI